MFFFSFSVAPYNVMIMGVNLYNQGEQLQLNCLSEGGPELEYTWLFSGSMIPNANNNILVINNLITTDGGDYTCNVINAAGNSSSTVTVYSKFTIAKHFYLVSSLNSMVGNSIAFMYIAGRMQKKQNSYISIDTIV